MAKKYKTYVVLNDIHIPKHNKKAVFSALKAINLIKPDGVVLNGDIMDCGTFSRHDIYSPPKCHWTDSQFYEASMSEYEETNAFLDRLFAVSPKSEKIFLYGNHEMWVKDFISKSPEIRKNRFSLEDRLFLKERGFTIYSYNDFIQLGKLKVTHGIYTCQNHARKHLVEIGSSILYGHLHNLEVASKTTPDKISHMAWANGCLCDLNPEYLRNRPQNWNHGFAIVYVWPNREFQVDLIRIQNGRCVVWGKELVG